MKHEKYEKRDRPTDAWLDKLDAIASGDILPSADDDELLHIAARLTSALASFRETESATEIRRQRLLSHLHMKRANVTHKPMHRLSRSSMLIAALLLLVLAVGARLIAPQVWHASTSFDQINGITVGSLARPHAGLMPLPLLPTALPSGTQASTYGVITDASNPNILTTFVADYHVAGQDILLYEQPSALPFSSSIAKTVPIGTIQGQLFQDDAGNNALQWYQHGMECQITSKLPVNKLVALASIFEPINSWEFILS